MPPPYPVLRRTTSDKIVAGVCRGVAYHLNLPVGWVRLFFLLFGLISWSAVPSYLLCWVLFSKESPEEQQARLNNPVPARPIVQRMGERGQSATKALDSKWLGITMLLALVAVQLTLSDTHLHVAYVIVVLLLAAAVAVWLYYDGAKNLAPKQFIISAAGMALLLLSTVFWLNADGSSEGIRAARPELIAVCLGIAGMLIVAAPMVVTLWKSLTRARAEALAAEERAKIAAHLHDSVLQTLALIQRRATDSEEVVRLARSQERELRQWLFDAQKTTDVTLFGLFTEQCGQVEDLYGVTISPVTVGGDIPVSAAVEAIVFASREAMVNAAKHAEVSSIDVYAEHSGDTVETFVRDRGVGFDPEAVSEERHGIRESIEARLSRVGGTAEIKSVPGEGTEVHCIVQVS